MRFRAAKLLPVVIIATFAAPALNVMATHPAQAETCLTKPNEATPAGKHWRYRVERGSKRHCWYLGEKRGAAPAHTTAANDTPSSDGEQKSPPASLANARAELIAGPAGPTASAALPATDQAARRPAEPLPAPAATESSAPADSPWSLASRWADATTPQDQSTSPAIAPPAEIITDTPVAASVSQHPASPPDIDQRWLLMAGLVTAFGLAAGIVKLLLHFANTRPLRVAARPTLDALNEPAWAAAPPWPQAPTPPRPQPLESGDEMPRQQPPNWVRVAQQRAAQAERVQAERASEAVEELLAQLALRKTA